MTTQDSEVRSIAWAQAFPFVRLFSTTWQALDPQRLVMALVAVVLLYIGGRALDSVWGDAGGARHMLDDDRVTTELQVYATLPYDEFRDWVDRADQTRDAAAIQAVINAKKAEDRWAARDLLREQSLESILVDDEFEKQLADLQQFIEVRLEGRIEHIVNDDDLTSRQRDAAVRDVRNTADMISRILARAGDLDSRARARGAAAVNKLLESEPAMKMKPRSERLQQLGDAIARQTRLRQYEQTEPSGPFMSLVNYEQHCFTAAIHGALAGRWGFGDGAFDKEPTMLASIADALKGFCWMVTQRPWYAFFCGVLTLLVLSYFGGGICRSAAVHSAREESISMSDALSFVRERYTGFLMAPLLPLGIFLGIAILMFIGGLIGAIPFIGELVVGLLTPIGLLGGFAMAMILLAVLLGFHLMWPTIAVEGSDGFDALSRACSYVGSRIWYVAFYTFVLLVYGALSYVLVRLVVMFTLKLTHACTGWGMNLVSGAGLSGVGKLDAMWHMPAWAELSILPTNTGYPVWGDFPTGPHGGAEESGAFLLMIWVFLLVSVLGAFIVSYFFCGSTQMYFLLRRNVDATDYDEIYFEEPEDLLPPAEPLGETSVGDAASASESQPGSESGEATDGGSGESGQSPPSDEGDNPNRPA